MVYKRVGNGGQRLKTVKISDAVVRRLPIYLRYLNELALADIQTVNSQELGEKLDLNPAQIRKDLAYFGDFGKKGIGYDVDFLIEQIRHILKLDKKINVVLIGAGNLGHALSNYNSYQKDAMRIVAVFDQMEVKVGQKINHLDILPMDKLSEVVKANQIRIGIITVPATEAQQVANALVDAGVEAILNFAPIIIRVPNHVRVQNADFTTELHSLAYYLD
jgi:redox-sensing transcriptional repressor